MHLAERMELPEPYRARPYRGASDHPAMAPVLNAYRLHLGDPERVDTEQLDTTYAHLDDCDPDNGALRVIPGSHVRGRLAPADIDALVSNGEEAVCASPAGGALVMRPLLLHASSPAKTPRHRRIVHLDYANVELPNGLEWSSAA